MLELWLGEKESQIDTPYERKRKRIAMNEIFYFQRQPRPESDTRQQP
jgi:hypothetical protein